MSYYEGGEYDERKRRTFMFVMTNLFPVLIIGLSFWASIVYYIGKMPLHGSYWLFAGALNMTVMMMKEV